MFFKKGFAKLEIAGFDSRGPETSNDIASISFKDPTRRKNIYCVGFKYKGSGNLKDLRSWETVPDHINYWDFENAIDNWDVEPKDVAKEEVERILSQFLISTRELLVQYCELIRID